jgi:hypothetical protein
MFAAIAYAFDDSVEHSDCVRSLRSFIFCRTYASDAFALSKLAFLFFSFSTLKHLSNKTFASLHAPKNFAYGLSS